MIGWLNVAHLGSFQGNEQQVKEGEDVDNDDFDDLGGHHRHNKQAR